MVTGLPLARKFLSDGNCLRSGGVPLSDPQLKHFLRRMTELSDAIGSFLTLPCETNLDSRARRVDRDDGYTAGMQCLGEGARAADIEASA